MTDFTAEVERLTKACRAIFGDPSTWITANGYPDSLALCVIDSLWSTGPRYQAVENVVRRYSSHRQLNGGDAAQDGTFELMNVIKKAGGSNEFAKLVENHNKAHTRPGALLKAEVVHQAAIALHGMGIRTMQDLRAQYEEDRHLPELKRVWLQLPSQKSGVTFNYLLILAGYPSVKPDRMVIRFVKKQAGITRDATPSQTADMIMAGAELYPVAANRLDHVIWRQASGRKVFRDEK
ncbi:hypothetical protein [Arthrobacter sp. NPDC057013]|uniref:hypothetical protein n=1 Tax=Arthrobacter sp. NPDC057013 TaxID=3345999 RepID=UPI00362FB08E